MVELPPELERHIFEWAAHIHPGTGPVLMRVSKYVASWIEPILYEIVIVGVKSRGSRLSLEALKKYGRHVRHLLLGDVPNELTSQYLASCPGTINLGIWTSRKLNEEAINTLNRLPLERLCIHLDAIFNYKDLLFPQAERILSAFHKLTHLDIASDSSPEPITTCLNLLPKLSHLSLPRDFRNVRETVQKYLQDIPKLKYVLVVSEGHGSEDYSEDLIMPDDDQRVVRCLVLDFFDDWNRGARGEKDMWVYVKEVAEKRSGIL
ncbi:hypothetical protein BDN72DRAFT_158514 [Pluteus cervinus]|uniref:Uncharacterized protein n=1 Tax=Pluteus cervinus TaxID=181527 RepID=A0ACD3AL73_9AGAR|nr:hypothetical protein BDN72DRAFT_158514 [Pluteus cervinus]